MSYIVPHHIIHDNSNAALYSVRYIAGGSCLQPRTSCLAVQLMAAVMLDIIFDNQETRLRKYKLSYLTKALKISSNSKYPTPVRDWFSFHTHTHTHICYIYIYIYEICWINKRKLHECTTHGIQMWLHIFVYCIWNLRNSILLQWLRIQSCWLNICNIFYVITLLVLGTDIFPIHKVYISPGHRGRWWKLCAIIIVLNSTINGPKYLWFSRCRETLKMQTYLEPLPHTIWVIKGYLLVT